MYCAAKCDDLCLACLLPLGHSLPDHSCVGLGHVPATVSGFSFFPHLLHKCLFLQPASDPCRASRESGGGSLNSAVVYHTLDWHPPPPPPRITPSSQIGLFSPSCLYLSCGFPHSALLSVEVLIRPLPA